MSGCFGITGANGMLAYFQAAGFKLALCTATPVVTDGVLIASNETTQPNYSQQSITFGTPVDGVIVNSNNIVYLAPGGEYDPITDWIIFDVDGNFVYTDAFHSPSSGTDAEITVNVGDGSISIPINF